MSTFAHPPETIAIGELTVRRLGYGAMRLPGPEVWGEPANPSRAVATVRRAIELGVNFIDTAWYYGPWVSNRILVEALHPYPSDLVIATKLGGMRRPDKSWGPANRPEELRRGCEDDLRTLRRERLDVVHLRWIPSGVPLDDQLGALLDLQREGNIRHIGLSNVNRAQVAAALTRTPIVTVQNPYSAGGGGGRITRLTHAVVEDPDAVLSLCEERGIAFLPFFPLAVGALGSGERPALDAAANRHGATRSQIALAWLLARSPVILPIPGTGSPEHVEENWGARRLPLTSDDVQAIADETRALDP